MSHEKEITTAIRAVRQAALLCEQVRRNIPAAIEKEDRSPVTIADFGSQALICRLLKETFPDDSVVAEEDSSTLGSPEMAEALEKVTGYVARQVPGARPDEVKAWIDRGDGSVASRYWTLDPVDGTKGFLRNDQYAVALALVEEGEVRLGVLGCPALATERGDTGVLFFALRGRGAHSESLDGGDPVPLRAVGSDDPDHMRFVESVESSHSDQERQSLIARAVGIRAPSIRIDSQAKYGVVASGKAALYLRLPSPSSPDYRENIWDHAAGSIIVEEAGGRVTDMHGRPLEFTAAKMLNNRGVIVSNGLVHEQVLNALAKGAGTLEET